MGLYKKYSQTNISRHKSFSCVAGVSVIGLVNACNYSATLMLYMYSTKTIYPGDTVENEEINILEMQRKMEAHVKVKECRNVKEKEGVSR